MNELLCEQWVGGMSKTDLADFFPQTVPKKYPRAPGDIPPPHKSAHNDILCTDSKGNQAKQDKHGGGVPLAAVLLCVARCLFLAFCIDRTRRAFNRIAYTTKANRKQTDKAKASIHITEKHNEKAETSTRREKQKERKQESIKRNKQKQKKADRAIILKYQNKQREKQL